MCASTQSQQIPNGYSTSPTEDIILWSPVTNLCGSKYGGFSPVSAKWIHQVSQLYLPLGW